MDITQAQRDDGDDYPQTITIPEDQPQTNNNGESAAGDENDEAQPERADPAAHAADSAAEAAVGDENGAAGVDEGVDDRRSTSAAIPGRQKYTRETDKAWYASYSGEDWDHSPKTKPWCLFSEHDLESEWNTTQATESDESSASDDTVLEKAAKRGMEVMVEEKTRSGEWRRVPIPNEEVRVIECGKCGNKMEIAANEGGSSSGNTGNTSMASIGSDEEWS